MAQGLNSFANESVDRSFADDAGFGSIGFGRLQAADPPLPTAVVGEWGGGPNSGYVLISKTGDEAGDSSGVSRYRRPLSYTRP